MEPERPIEKMLREWAKRRREETKAPDLHPATRRMLQGEVARKFGQTAEPSRSLSAWLAAFWPRIAWGMGVFAVLAVAAWLVLPPLGGGSRTAHLAKGEKTRGYEEEFKRQAPLANEPAPTAADAVQLRRDGRSESQAVHIDSANGKLTDEKLPHTPELAAADKDAREVRAPASPAAVTEVTRAQQPQPSARPGFAGPAQRATPPVSGAGERAGAVAQSTTSSLQPIAPANANPQPPAASSPSPPMVAAGPSPAPSVSTADGLQSSSSAASKSRYGLAMGGAKTDASATLAASTPPPSSTVKQAASESNVTMRNRSIAAAEPSAPAATYFYSDASKKDTPHQVQHFWRVETETKAKALSLDSVAPSKAILASFELQQVGKEVRILDNDGSVYTGYVQPTTAGGSRLAISEKAEATDGARSFRSVNGATTASSSETEALTPQNYFFRVSGTNRSLNLPIVFTASVVPADASRAITVTNAVALRGALRDRAQFGPSPQTNAAKLKISGHAVLGDREQVDINAVSK